MKKVKVSVSVGSKIFFYRGEILSETADELVIDDQKIGRLGINKKNIILREEKDEI